MVAVGGWWWGFAAPSSAASIFRSSAPFGGWGVGAFIRGSGILAVVD